MGNCQCIEISSNGSVNEMVIEKFYVSKSQRKDTLNAEDEDDMLIKDGCKKNNLVSTFKNFKKNNPKMNRSGLVNMINESQKSEILFEDFSYLSRKTAESSVDYYQISKNIFDFINRIRLHPEKYVNMITSIINEFSTSQESNGKEREKEKEKEIEVDKNLGSMKDLKQLKLSSSSLGGNNNPPLSINEQIKSYLKEEENLQNLIELRDILLKIIESTEKKTDFILWSEKVYLAAYDYLIEVEEKVSNNKEFIEKSSSQRVSEKLKINSICTEFNFNGIHSYSPELTVFFLLLENKERFKNILLDNYAYGAACMFPLKEGVGGGKTRSLFYFVNKNLKQPKISGSNPHTGLTQELGLDEPLFYSINYKHLIVDGTYFSDGDKLNVKFNLIDGKKKEAVFLLS
jgi:hypothetical protein